MLHVHYLTASVSLAIAKALVTRWEITISPSCLLQLPNHVFVLPKIPFSFDRMMSVGKTCHTSEYHLALVFANDAGLTKEKQIKNTPVCREDRGVICHNLLAQLLAPRPRFTGF